MATRLSRIGSSIRTLCGVCRNAKVEDKTYHFECGCYACVDCLMENIKCNRIKGRKNLECLSCSVTKRDKDQEDKLLARLRSWAEENPADYLDTFQKFNNFLIESAEEKDKTFCAHPPCTASYAKTGKNRAMTCGECKKKTCHNCKLPWHFQHKNTPCFKYKLWVQEHKPEWYIPSDLEEVCFTCPNCKKQFEMVRGGCLHFDCPSCEFEFCGFCREPFHTQKRNPCSICSEDKQGIHAHHPRICPYFLRDKDVQWLWKLVEGYGRTMDELLRPNQPKGNLCNVKYNTDSGTAHCTEKVEEKCQGFCPRHFQESVSGAIFRDKTIDPIRMMNLCELRIVADREKVLYEKEWDEKEMRMVIAKQRPLTRQIMGDPFFTCPQCKTKHDLYRDGNCRFECSYCYQSFCGFCAELYFGSKQCNICPPSVDKGIHAHHPRICPYYLIDQEVSWLYELLEKHNRTMNQVLKMNTESGAECGLKFKSQGDKTFTICKKSVEPQCQGYCLKHFRLLLSEIIFKSKDIDPVMMMTDNQLRAVLGRDSVPYEATWDRKKLVEVISNQLPLKKSQ